MINEETLTKINNAAAVQDRNLKAVEFCGMLKRGHIKSIECAQFYKAGASCRVAIPMEFFKLIIELSEKDPKFIEIIEKKAIESANLAASECGADALALLVSIDESAQSLKPAQD